MELEEINKDPLKERVMGSNYITPKFKLKLLNPKIPDYDNFISLGNESIIDRWEDCKLEIFVTRESLIKWCEASIENGFGWYLLREVAPFLLRDLKSGYNYIHFFEVVKKYRLKELEDEKAIYADLYDQDNPAMDDSDITERDVVRQAYTFCGNLHEDTLLKHSRELRYEIFGYLLQRGEVLIVRSTPEGNRVMAEIEYYGRGFLAGPLAGQGGVHFVYDGHELYYRQTWIS